MTFGTQVGEGHGKAENLHVWTDSGIRPLKEHFVLSNQGLSGALPRAMQMYRETHTYASSPAKKLCGGVQSLEKQQEGSSACLASWFLQHLSSCRIICYWVKIQLEIHTSFHPSFTLALKNKTLTVLSCNSPFVPLLMKREAPGEALHQQTFKIKKDHCDHLLWLLA